MPRDLVIIISPFAGVATKRSENIKYARKCMRDSLMRGECPFAYHLLYPQTGILNDDDSQERFLGFVAGHAWMKKADVVAVYEDLGKSAGMIADIRFAHEFKKKVIYRKLGYKPSPPEKYVERIGI